MRKKVLLSLSVLFICLLSVHGQQLHTYTNNSCEDWLIPGTLTYTYYVGDDGNYVKHGKYSLRCSLSKKHVWNSQMGRYDDISISYSALTNFKHGWLDGSLIISVKNSNVYSNGSDTRVTNLTANYKNGVPNGAWKFTNTDDGKVKYFITMSFSNGKLVGAFEMMDELKGQFDSQGRYTGRWISYHPSWGVAEKEYNYLNGVFLSSFSRDKNGQVIESDNDVELIAIAKKYATGQLTEEDLKELGYQISYGTGLSKIKTVYDVLYSPLYHLALDKLEDGVQDYGTMGEEVVYLQRCLTEDMFNSYMVMLGLVMPDSTHRAGNPYNFVHEGDNPNWWRNYDNFRKITSKISNTNSITYLVTEDQNKEFKRLKAARIHTEALLAAEKKRVADSLAAEKKRIENLRLLRISKLQQQLRARKSFCCNKLEDIKKHYEECIRNVPSTTISSSSASSSSFLGSLFGVSSSKSATKSTTSSVKQKYENYYKTFKQITESDEKKIRDYWFLESQDTNELKNRITYVKDFETFLDAYSEFILDEQGIKMIADKKSKIAESATKGELDVVQAYNSHFDSYNLIPTYKTKEDCFLYIGSLYVILQEEDTCLAFIEARKQLTVDHQKLLKAAKKCKTIGKVYSEYYNKADKSWAPLFPQLSREYLIRPSLPGKKIDAIRAVQQIFMQAVTGDNAAMLESEVKKMQDKSFENVLKLIQKN